MWSENIRLHNWLVNEDGSGPEYWNCGVCYIANNWCLHPDTGYTADDWYVDIAAFALQQNVSITFAVNPSGDPSGIAWTIGSTSGSTTTSQTVQVPAGTTVNVFATTGGATPFLGFTGLVTSSNAQATFTATQSGTITANYGTTTGGGYSITIHVQNQTGSPVAGALVTVT